MVTRAKTLTEENDKERFRFVHNGNFEAWKHFKSENRDKAIDLKIELLKTDKDSHVRFAALAELHNIFINERCYSKGEQRKAREDKILVATRNCISEDPDAHMKVEAEKLFKDMEEWRGILDDQGRIKDQFRS